jgi:tetratricopeptide (TPR) repeat protein
MLKKTFITVTTVFLLATFFFAVQPEINAQSKKDKRRAEKLVQDGNKLFNQNDFKTAIDRYAQAITIYPGFAEAHFWKGNAHYRLNQNDQAVYDLDIALQQGYKPLEIYKLRWFLYYQRQNYDAALKDAEAGLKLQPDEPFFLLAVGDVYRGKKDYENALVSYEKVAATESKNADLPYYMAVSYNGLKRYEKQGAAAQEAIRKGTKFPGEAWYLVGDAYLREKNYDQATEAFERSIIANDKIYDTYTTLADTYRLQGNFKKAISTLGKGLKAFENDGGFLVNLTWYHSLAGNNGEAIREGQKAIVYAKDNSMAFTNLCRAYSDSGLHKQALDTCKEALKINPNDGETHYYMGRAYVELKQSDAATAEFKKAVASFEAKREQINNNPDTLYIFGGSYLADNQYDNAIETYKKAIEMIPLFSRAHFNLAYAYYKKGDKDSARRQYEKLKDFDPSLAAKLADAIEIK